MSLDPSAHPNPLHNPHHRKIELQSLQDLIYLQNNLHSASTQKLDLHFPPSALQKPVEPATYISLGGDASHATSTAPSTTAGQNGTSAETDPMRTRVESLVNAFLQRTWDSASNSISINGLDATSVPHISPFQAQSQTPAHLQSQTQTDPSLNLSEQELEGRHFQYTPYDSRLQTHLASLYGELESLTAQVSKLRREAPSSGAERYAEDLTQALKDEDEAYEDEIRRLKEESEGLQPSQDGTVKGKQIQTQTQTQIHTHSQTQPQSQIQTQSQSQSKSNNILQLHTPRNNYHEDLRQTYEQGVMELARLAGSSKNPSMSAFTSASVSASGSGGAAAATTNTRTDAGGSGGGSMTLTETVGKVQRARTVAMEFE